jgi:hypothetical protein
MAKDARIPLFPKPGVYRGATPDVSTSRWFDMNLMRWRGDQLQPIGGWAEIAGIETGYPGRDLMTWHDNSSHRWAIYGCDMHLHAYNFDTSTTYNITPAGVAPLDPPGSAVGYGLANYSADAYGTARDPADIGVVDIAPLLGDMWSLDLYGEDVMIVPTQDGRLFRWSPATPTTLPAVVANAPINNAGVVVTDERVVVLLGAGGNRRLVQWSDVEAPTVWAPDITNLAGNKELQTEGRPLNAIRVAGGVLIFTDNDVHLMHYAGPPYAYGIGKIGSNCGPISRRAIGQSGGVTMWMAQQSFWAYDGSLTPFPSDVGDWLFSLINRDMVGRTFAMSSPAFSEIWWFFPDEGAQECNRYVAVNYADPSHPWIVGQLVRTSADIKGAMTRPIAGTIDGRMMLHEYGWLDDGNPRVGTVFVETGTVALNDGEDTRWTVKQIVQDFTGPGDRLGYRFFLWEEPNGPEYDTGTYRVVNDSGRTDIGAGFSCRGLRMRLEALSDGPFAIGRTRLIARAGGRL